MRRGRESEGLLQNLLAERQWRFDREVHAWPTKLRIDLGRARMGIEVVGWPIWPGSTWFVSRWAPPTIRHQTRRLFRLLDLGWTLVYVQTPDVIGDPSDEWEPIADHLATYFEEIYSNVSGPSRYAVLVPRPDGGFDWCQYDLAGDELYARPSYWEVAKPAPIVNRTDYCSGW